MALLRSYFLLVVLLLSAVQVPSAAAESYAAIRSDYYQLAKSARLQQQRVNWEKLIRRFERYLRQKPASPSVEKALFLKARTWDGLSLASGGREDAREAISSYLALVTLPAGWRTMLCLLPAKSLKIACTISLRRTAITVGWSIRCRKGTCWRQQRVACGSCLSLPRKPPRR
ncbi:MAG: hypothetical protein GXP51_03760 [Deltaproteobacteria bacterium]|nr:hypothetical protein [Deltaproteobacteria bacterium]